MKTTIACSLATVAGLAVAAGFYGCAVDDNGGSQDSVKSGSGSSTDESGNVWMRRMSSCSSQFVTDSLLEGAGFGTLGPPSGEPPF